MQGIIGHRTAVPLGRGSTSQVYRVYDDRRQRWLAVKYLHHGDPIWRARLVREARAVRQLDHPHICPILEIGEHEGRPWLSMPLIEGRTLDQVASELPLEARIRVLKQVAEAVHHAHEHGLLHRDLKPANIIVQLDDGLPHAWVLDFGLIREIGTSNGTQLGEVVGTPAYMAPEQARGQSDLDRRTDVYSLGAILYVLLTGQPPFSGTSSAEVLARTISEQPIPPHRLRAGVPRSLSAIALQCLEKSPVRRYDSARALANDLDRYLHGAAVAARHGIGTAMRRFIQTHPRLAPVGATLVAAIIVLAAVLATQSARTREQVHQATRIAAQAESARQQLALAFTRPAHDVRPSLARAISTAEQLLQSANNHPASLRANALGAAGSIHLATHNVDEARRHLLAAAEIAPSPDLHRLIGLAYARAYRAVLAEPALLSDPLLRQTRIQRARLELLDPARHHLAAAGDGDWLAQAELAFTEERYDEARLLLAQALQQQPDVYEARVIDAEVLMAQGQQAHWSGERSTAVKMFGLADTAIGKALDFARSDPLLHRRRCEIASLRYEAIAEDTHARQALLDDVNAGMATCRQALRVQPDAAATHTALAQLLGNRAKIERITGGDAVTTLRQGLTSASTAVDLGTRRHPATCFACADSADAARAARMLALLNMRLSTTLRWSGQPAPELTGAAETALKPWLSAVSLDPELLFIAALVAGEKGQTLAAVGADPEPDLRRSIDLLRQATGLVPQAAFVRHNLASMLSSLQYHLANQGRPDPAVSREAIGEIEAVLRDQPERASAWSSLADSHWDLALTLAYRGEPLGDSLALTHSHYARALERAPDNLGIMFNWYSFSLFAAGEQQRNDGDPSTDVERARKLMDRMDRIRPDWITPCPRAEYHLQQAALSIRSALPSQGRRHLALARDLLDGALEQQPDDVDCARRSIELATLRLKGDDADAALVGELFADALPHYQSHRDIPQIQLAWLELLASGAGQLHGDDRERVSTEMKALKKTLLSLTGAAWRGRLSLLAIDD